MNIIHCKNYGEMSRLAASLVLINIREDPGSLLCAATGSSPEGLYRELAATASTHTDAFSKLRVLKLDEWGGIPLNHPVSCEYFLQKRLLEALKISPERFISFHSDPENPELECKRIRSRIEKEGPIDICILGLGANGHLALNEPAARLQPYAHVAELSRASLQHPMIASLEQKPAFGLTLGMEEILSSRFILMLVSGANKKNIALRFLSGEVSPELPASYLWKHPDVTCLVDRQVLS